MKAHILPQVLLRGFRVDNKRDKKKARIMVLKEGNIKTQKISDSYYEIDFYGDELETHLSKEYESPFGIIKKRLMDNTDKKEIILSKEDIMFLARFSTVMWRRQSIHLKKTKGMLEESFFLHGKNPETESVKLNNSLEYREKMYNATITRTNERDPTVIKTAKYKMIFLYNETKINFPMHSKYGTSNYVNHSNKNIEYPDFLLEPLNNKVMILRFLQKEEVEDSTSIKIVNVNDKKVIIDIIKMYVIYNANSYIVDDTNVELVKELSGTVIRDYDIKSIISLNM